MEDLLAGLNPEQRQAVEHVAGPLLVIAGPGSGKTRVITRRIAHLIAKAGVPAHRILAVTFTNKAAAEMRARVDQLVYGKRPWTCTFHSFCARILREYSSTCGLEPNFSILDQTDRGKVVADVMRGQGLDLVHFPPDAVDRRISALKNDLITPEEFLEGKHDILDGVVAKVYPAYQEQLRNQNAVDFDDLLYYVAQMLRNDPDARAQLDHRFEYVLVDEYQDTNLAQYAIARGLSVLQPNLCVTGDPDQSIYSWRGANLNNILNFEEDFPGARVIRLEQNYRSTANILKAADVLIRNNQLRKHKELRTDNPRGIPVQVQCHKDDTSEAGNVAQSIREAVDTGRRRFRDYAVFVRMSSLTRTVEAAFRARHIPYQVIGGFSFFERKEIRDLLAYVRLVLNPRDDSAFLRAVNTPPRGIGATTIQKIRDQARKRRLSLIEACDDPQIASTIRGKPGKSIAAFMDLYHEMRKVVDLPPGDAIEAILGISGYRDSIQGSEEEVQERLGIVDDLVAGAKAYLTEQPEATLTSFAEAISLASDADTRDEESDLVTIMTLHAAKGLEFPCVYLVAFEYDILPHERSVRQGNEEEERRLAFVGITRAREELVLSYTCRRIFQGRVQCATPSPFLHELPDEVLDRDDVVTDQHAWNQESEWHGDEPAYEEPSIQIVRRSMAPSASDRFSRGMMVEHPRYGRGLILQVEGVGENRKATIQFPSVGAKRFMLSKAPLEPVIR